jgi:hypothetical protein
VCSGVAAAAFASVTVANLQDDEGGFAPGVKLKGLRNLLPFAAGKESNKYQNLEPVKAPLLRYTSADILRHCVSENEQLYGQMID